MAQCDKNPHKSVVQFKGNGFLRKMIRHLVGALIAVGQHRIKKELIVRLLREGMPEEMEGGGARGWNTADACGLHKIDVEYPDGVDLTV
jgi:tRNA U38,U39,U40 pseudouridine synthase TruA